MKLKKKIKVGIVGENAQNDAQALQALLNSVLETGVELSIYPKKFEGGQLDGDKFFRSIAVEAQFLDWIILVRDLDGLESDTTKLREKDLWFDKVNKKAAKKGIFFLVIYEMEALILADIEGFNRYYGLQTQSVGNPISKFEPKELLKKMTAKTQKGVYKENQALDIFKSLNFKTIYKNHKGERSFQTFADELKDKKLINF